MMQVEKSQGEVYRLKARLENAQGEQESLRDEYERAQSSVARLHSERDKAVAELEKVQEELERTQATLGKAQLQQDRLQNLLDKTQSDADKLQERLDKSHAEIRRVSICLIVEKSHHSNLQKINIHFRTSDRCNWKRKSKITTLRMFRVSLTRRLDKRRECKRSVKLFSSKSTGYMTSTRKLR